MREFTKSIFSFSWAMSLFGIQQGLNLMQPSEAVKAFDAVTDAAKGELGDTMKAAFSVGDNLQKGAVDMTFGVFSADAFNPSRWFRTTTSLMQQSAEAVGQSVRSATAGVQKAASGWGPMPGGGAVPGTQGQAPPATGSSQTSSQSQSSGAQTQGWGPMPGGK